MTKETGYRKMRAKYERMVKEAKRSCSLSGSKRDKEYLKYVKLRLSRYETDTTTIN